MAVLDREAPGDDRGGIVMLAEIAHHAGIDRGGNGQRLEGGAEFIDLVGHPVEHQRLTFAVDPVGVEFRQRGERQHLARIDIEHDPGRPDRIGRQHPAAQFILERALHPRIERQRHRGAARRRVGQLLVEDRLHPDAAMIVGRDIAEDVRRHPPLRIMAIVFLRHLERQFADRLHLVGIFGQHAAAQIAGPARSQPLGQRGLIEVGEDRRQLGRHLARPLDQRVAAVTERLGIEPQGIGREGAGQRHAVAVGNLAARGQQRIFERGGARGMIGEAEPENPQQRGERHQREDAGDQQHPDPRGFERTAAQGDNPSAPA